MLALPNFKPFRGQSQTGSPVKTCWTVRYIVICTSGNLANQSLRAYFVFPICQQVLSGTNSKMLITPRSPCGDSSLVDEDQSHDVATALADTASLAFW